MWCVKNILYAAFVLAIISIPKIKIGFWYFILYLDLPVQNWPGNLSK